MRCYAVLAPVSRSYSPLKGRLVTCYSPGRRCTHGVAPTFSLDLHVLGTPPALILSQDQTLVCIPDFPPRRKSGRAFRDQNRWLAPPAECQRNTIYFVRSLGLDRAFPSPALAHKGISRLARSTCCQRPSALRTRRCASVRTTAIAMCPRNLASLSSLQTRALYSAASSFLAFRDEPFKLIASFCCLSMYG